MSFNKSNSMLPSNNDTYVWEKALGGRRETWIETETETDSQRMKGRDTKRESKRERESQ